MKKQLLLFAMIMLLPIAAIAFTGDVVIDGIKYNISTKLGTATVLGLENPEYSGALIIPGYIDYEGKTCYVTTITTKAFMSCNGITSLKILEGVKEIESYAFKDCANLTTIEIPNSLKNIGEKALNATAWYENQSDGLIYLKHIALVYKGNMPSNTEIDIKEGTTVISACCFARQENMKSVTFPSTLKIINSSAFFRCKSLTSLFLRNLIVYDGAFENCTNLKEVFVDNVDFISLRNGNYFFYNCNGIEKITINNCKEIGPWFSGKPSLSSVSLGNMVEKIDDYAFSNCTSLKNIEIPKSVKYLSGFNCCTGLTKIDIPSSVVELGLSAFAGCTGLAEIDIPSSVVELGLGAFAGCTGLLSLSLPEGLKKIPNQAFSRCSSLTSVIIPNSVDTIEINSFGECTSLKSIVLPKNLKELGESAFWGCSNLASIHFPEGITTLNSDIFISCGQLSTIIIPRGVNTIYGGAFTYCPEITNVYCYATTVPVCTKSQFRGENPFESSDIQHATLYVPEQTIESYKAAKYWQDFGKIVAIPDYEAKKCAAPRVSYSKGKMSFSCDTEGAQFISDITDTDIKRSDMSTIDLTATYHISVYATAPDHVSSDTTKVTLCWIEYTPNISGIENIRNSEIEAIPVLIQAQDGGIVVDGVADNTIVSVYTTAGVKAGMTKGKEGKAKISTSLRKGETAIVKIGEKSVKVLMQ